MAMKRWRIDRERRDAGEVIYEESFEDRIQRFKFDRKGEVIRWGCSYGVRDGEVVSNSWEVRWSLSGRSDQFDVLFNGVVLFTGGKRRVRKRWPWLWL